MSKPIRIAVDAMGGEDAPKKVIDGINISLKSNKENFFLLFGRKSLIENLLEQNKSIKPYCEIIDVNENILDDESPLSAAKKGIKSSMWQSINSQLENKADITLSAGNTGALLVISRLILNMVDKIDKPALAGLWPNKVGANVVLDLGANIECSDKNLIDFCNMGSALYKSLYPDIAAKVALLNVGSEESKGSENLKKAYGYLKSNQKNYEFKGYVEGNEIMDGNINVIVTDGFTGNIALKTAEGTANFISKTFNDSLNIFSKILSLTSLKKLKNKFDPRKYNGAILLGLNGPVVKSHGSTDALGFSYSIQMCNKIVNGNLINKIKSNLA